jgi:Domain of unknown function (DUF6471)
VAADLHQEARAVLRQQMKARGLTVRDLSELLELTGLRENRSSLYVKIQRGTFQFAFFLRCIAAMNAHASGERSKATKLTIDVLPFEQISNSVDESKLRTDRRRKALADLSPNNHVPGSTRRPRGRPKLSETSDTNAAVVVASVKVRGQRPV